jgi:hypothetical protein
MTRRGCRATGLLAAIWLSISAVAVAADQSQLAAIGAAHEEVVVTLRARGTFEVKLTPEAPEGTPTDSALGRLVTPDGWTSRRSITGCTVFVNKTCLFKAALTASSGPITAT